MPALPLNVGDILEFRAHGLCQNQEVLTRFHYRCIENVAAGTTVTTEDCANELRDAFRTNLIPIMLTSFTIYQYFCGRIIAVTLPGGGDTLRIKYDQQIVFPGDAVQDTGTVAVVDQLPVFVAMNVRRRCLITNKNTRGAVRIAPHNEADQTNGTWTAARQTAVETALQGMVPIIVPVVGGLIALRHVVFSATLAVPDSPGPVWPDTVSEFIDSYDANPLVSSQVTRKIRPSGY